MARQLFLLSQPPLVVQVSFFSDSEHFLNRAKVNFEKSVYSSAPMNTNVASVSDTNNSSARRWNSHVFMNFIFIKSRVHCSATCAIVVSSYSILTF